MAAHPPRVVGGVLAAVAVLAAGLAAVVLAGSGGSSAPNADRPAQGQAGGPAPSRDSGPALLPQATPIPEEFRSTVAPVTAVRLGGSHRPGCPVPVGDLRLVTVTHRDDSGRTQQGEIVVHADVAAATVQIFRTLYDAGFPLARVATVEEFGSDDDRVMAANVTSAYNCRQKTGGSTFSAHAYGRAIDINPIQNPYVRGGEVLPPAGRAFLDRSDVRPGMVVAGDVVVRAFAAAGWKWGGDFRSFRDYQHFSQTGD